MLRNRRYRCLAAGDYRLGVILRRITYSYKGPRDTVIKLNVKVFIERFGMYTHFIGLFPDKAVFMAVNYLRLLSESIRLYMCISPVYP